jgi:hypothetical protein
MISHATTGGPSFRSRSEALLVCALLGSARRPRRAQTTMVPIDVPPGSVHDQKSPA